DRLVRWTQAVSMTALSISVELGGNTRLFQSQKILDSVLHVDTVVLCLYEKSLRCGGSHRNVRIELEVLFGERQISRINDQCEVRTAAQLIRTVDGRIQALLVMRAQCRRQVAACGESQHADALRIDVPLRSMLPNDAYSALRILKRRCRFGKRS